MTTARLHRYIFLMLCAVIVLLVVQLAYTTHRLNRLETAIAEVDRMAEDTLEAAKRLRENTTEEPYFEVTSKVHRYIEPDAR